MKGVFKGRGGGRKEKKREERRKGKSEEEDSLLDESGSPKMRSKESLKLNEGGV